MLKINQKSPLQNLQNRVVIINNICITLLLMKKCKFYSSLILLLIILFSVTGCKKNNPVDQLPPATQTGANTFGCLINGEIFLPKGPSLSPILQCAYQYLNTSYSKGYFFQLSAKEKGSKECELYSISLGTDSLQIFQSNTYPLVNYETGKTSAQYSYFYNCGQFINYNTSNNVVGLLTIKRLDEINQIVSGTFWFNAVSTNGDTTKVTDGRFDMQFTK